MPPPSRIDWWVRVFIQQVNKNIWFHHKPKYIRKNKPGKAKSTLTRKGQNQMSEQAFMSFIILFIYTANVFCQTKQILDQLSKMFPVASLGYKIVYILPTVWSLNISKMYFSTQSNVSIKWFLVGTSVQLMLKIALNTLVEMVSC